MLKGQKMGLIWKGTVFVSPAIFMCLLDEDTRESTLASLETVEVPYTDLFKLEIDIANQRKSPPETAISKPSTQGWVYAIPTVESLYEEFGEELMDAIVTVFRNMQVANHEFYSIAWAVRTFQERILQGFEEGHAWDTPHFSDLRTELQAKLKLNAEWFLPPPEV
jgi:hypothetical protein